MQPFFQIKKLNLLAVPLWSFKDPKTAGCVIYLKFHYCGLVDLVDLVNAGGRWKTSESHEPRKPRGPSGP